MRTIQPYQFTDFFGGQWPMFQGQGELTYEEFTRKAPLFGKLVVMFKDPADFTGWMDRAFNDREELLEYMRKWGLGANDICRIMDYTPRVKTLWCVLAYDPFYGGAYSAEGYRRRWYFETEAEAEQKAESLEAPWVVADIYQTQFSTF